MAMTAKQFGTFITRLIKHEDLSRTEAMACFQEILLDLQSDMQQGAFLAALAAKGETVNEIVGIWQAILELDTHKVAVNTRLPLVDNCGTGMDAVKTFNISTAASLIAAADGIPIARHGARAITSTCGTIDVLETLGINVECPPEAVRQSIETVGIGIFNGTSAQTHPKALGRILSQISFGSVLNIAASLANPAQPRLAVRGVWRRDMLLPIAKVMREIGYLRALVVFGEAGDKSNSLHSGGIDEASTIGRSFICELRPDKTIRQFELTPFQMGIRPARPADLEASSDRRIEAKRMVGLLTGKENRERTDIACLNAGLIMYVTGRQPSIKAGYRHALNLVNTKRPINKLIDWVNIQR